MLSFFPTKEKLISLNSEKSGSVTVVKWCFFLFSFLTVTTGMAFAGGVAVLLVLAALLVPTVGGLNNDRGSSTCALIYY